MLLGVFAHIDADHRPLIIEEELRESLGQLGLADSRWTEEKERSGRSIRVGNTRASTTYGVTDLAHRLGLPDDALIEVVLHAEQLLALTLEHATCGDAGPGRHHLGDVVGRDLLLHHRRLTRSGLRGDASQLLFERRDLGVEQLRCLLKVTGTLGLVRHRAHIVNQHLELTDAIKAGLLGVPRGAQAEQLLIFVRDLGTDALQPILGGVVRLLGNRHLLHPQAIDLALEYVDLHRGGVNLHAQSRGCLIHEVDGLIRQKA